MTSYEVIVIFLLAIVDPFKALLKITGFRLSRVPRKNQRCIVHVTACFRIVSPLEIQQEEEEQQQEKGCLMVMADPSNT